MEQPDAWLRSDEERGDVEMRLTCCSGCAGASYAIGWALNVFFLRVNVDMSRTGGLYWNDRVRVRDCDRIRNGICKTDRYGCTNEEE